MLIGRIGGAYSYRIDSVGISVDGSVRTTALKLPLLLKPKAEVGAGYEHRFDPGALNFEVRYNRTFTDIFDNDNTRINSINIFGGFGFDL